MEQTIYYVVEHYRDIDNFGASRAAESDQFYLSQDKAQAKADELNEKYPVWDGYYKRPGYGISEAYLDVSSM